MAKEKNKKALGKGLGALFSDDIEQVLDYDKAKDSKNLSINEIVPNINQPRRVFNKAELKALEVSISEHGIIQPILVTKIDDAYMIVAGERRWRAAKNIGLKEVPVYIKELSARQIAEIALIENLQREDLNPIEEAMAYQSLIDEYDCRQEDIANLVGKSRSYITNTIRLLGLDKTTLKALSNKEISSAHGRTLLSVKNEKVRLDLLKKVIDEKLSVRELEKIISGLDSKKKKAKPQKDDGILALEKDLQAHFGTKINIKHGKKRGKIEIEYYGLDDLERVLELLNLN